MTIAANGQITLTQTLIGTALDISGDIDVDGTTNLDVVDIDGAVDMATTLTLAGNADFNGDLDVDGTTNLDVVDIDGAVDMATTLAVAGNVDFNGDLDVDGTANLDNTDIDGTLNTSGVVTSQTSANISQVAISSSSNATAWDAAAAANAYYVTSENTTISAPSNAVEGAIISIEIAQGGTARTVAWNTVFEFAASTAPTVTATASKTDIFAFRYNGSVWQEIGRSQNMAQT